MTTDPAIHARRWKILAVLSLSLVVIGLDNTILNVALPSLQEAFGASSSTLQWIVDAYLLVYAGLLLAVGVLGDRFGRKLLLQAGLLLFGAASLAALLVDSSGQLIAVRALMGVGGATIMPATLSIIANVFPKEERAKAIGIWAAMASIGVGLGPLFGGLLLEWFDWHAVFLFNVPIVAVAFVLGMRLVPESRDPRPGSFDLAGMALSAAALFVAVYGIIEAPERGWTDPLVLGCFAAGLACAAGFVAVELRRAEPMLDLKLLREPRFGVAAAAIALSSFALFGASFAMTQFLQDARGASALTAGVQMIPLAFGLLLGAGSSTKLVERAGTARIVTAGMVGLGVALASTLAWSDGMPYWPVGVNLFAIALFMGWIAGPCTASVMGAVTEEKSGVASAMNDVTRQVAGALGTAVIGSLVTTLYDASPDATAAEDPAAFTAALGIALAVAGAVALVGALWVRRALPCQAAEHERAPVPHRHRALPHPRGRTARHDDAGATAPSRA